MNQTKVYRIKILHDTTMWNEGFDNAVNPWLAFYTKNSQDVNVVERIVEAKNQNNEFDKLFIVESFLTDLPVQYLNQLESERKNSHSNDFEMDWELGLINLPPNQLQKNVQDRIDQWFGI